MEREHETQTNLTPQALKWELTALLDKLAVVASEEHQADIAEGEKHLMTVIDNLGDNEERLSIVEPATPVNDDLPSWRLMAGIVLLLVVAALLVYAFTRRSEPLIFALVILTASLSTWASFGQSRRIRGLS